MAQANQVKFALSLTLVTSTDMTDFSTADGKAIHEAAIKSSHSDSKFHCTGSGSMLSNFLCVLSEQADAFGWNDDGMLDMDAHTGNLHLPVLSNLWENCGTVPMEQCRRHVEACMNTQSRAAQDDSVL